MKTKLPLIFVLISALLFPNLVYSADERLCQQGVFVVFGNGVWNDKEQADSSRRLLTRRLESHVAGTDLEGIMTYITAHNPSDGTLLDLVETFEQNLQTDWSQFWRYLAGLDPMPDFFQNKLIEIANAVDESILHGNSAVQDHIEAYNKFLSEGNKVVVVAHSQGNLFANIAYLGIASQYIDGFGIVSVGNPDNYVAGSGPYITLDEDIIIGNVPMSLPANIDNFFGINMEDLTGHMFKKSYMASGHQAESILLDDVVNMINSLKLDRKSSLTFLPADLETLNPTIVNRGESGRYAIEGGVPPFDWDSSNSEFVLEFETTNDYYNIVNVATSARGHTKLTVTDSCGDEVDFTIITDIGTWVYKGSCRWDITGMPAVRYCGGIYGGMPTLQPEVIKNGELWRFNNSNACLNPYYAGNPNQDIWTTGQAPCSLPPVPECEGPYSCGARYIESCYSNDCVKLIRGFSYFVFE